MSYMYTHIVNKGTKHDTKFMRTECSQLPLQAQSAVHPRYAFRHSHLRLHPVCSLYPHYVISKQHCDASGMVVQAGSHISQDTFFKKPLTRTMYCH